MSELLESVVYIKKFSDFNPKIGIILGSGLGSFVDIMDSQIHIPSKTIPHYPQSTVAGHEGSLVFGMLQSTPLLVVKGRTHYYEGYPIERVTYVVRIMSQLGIKLIIVTNAAGSVNRSFKPGELVLITDHINFMFCNPLIGPLKYDGPRFPDMSDPYCVKFHPTIESIALENNIQLKRGVLYASSGPSYETAAEVQMISKIGADMVSMSTVPEVIVANQTGLDIIGISCITNMATGISTKPLNHSEVMEIANLVKFKLIKLITGIIMQLSGYY
ncbi:purine nucleoside phosphorylase [miscellaneous Crenarchaeota group archaeon SMTZ-80]|nr:MAG: purine nucleoside phosphorylase [miscellaneous Crenarchaeota group archaeon SMTZ-80]